ncbi:MAG: dihydroneopterin aldolase [Pseudomonadota bacterium]
MKYTIELKNCAFFARHGVFNEEETLGQRFFVDAHLTVDGGDALEKDEIAGTVDYGAAFGVISAIVTGERYYLIEALALKTAQSLCSEFPQVTDARVAIRKPNAPVQGILDTVEVSVHWSAQRP